MYRAKDTFWAPDNRRIVKGDLVAEHDTVVRGRENLFEEVIIPTAVAPEPRTRGGEPTSTPDQAPAPETDESAPEPGHEAPETEQPAAPAAKAPAKKAAPRPPKGGTRR